MKRVFKVASKAFLQHFCRSCKKGPKNTAAHAGATDGTWNCGFGYIHYGLTRVYRPDKVMTIGSRVGLIPAYYSQAVHDNGKGVLIFVDPSFKGQRDKDAWGGEGNWDGPKKAERMLNRAGSTLPIAKEGEPRLEHWKLLSSEALDELIKRDWWLDILYLDGDHSYKGLTYDITELGTRVRKGGLILMHDISVPLSFGNHFGGRQIVKELREQGQPFVALPGGMGLGILQKE